MLDVVDDVGVLGELAPQPRGVGQGAKGAAEEVHAGPPVEVSITVERLPAMTNFGFPFRAPLSARRAGHDESATARTSARQIRTTSGSRRVDLVTRVKA